MNRLFNGDNLDTFRDPRKIAAGSVDLCYIDPPFNSKRNYFQIYNNQGVEDRALAQAFVDTWNWGDEAAAGLKYILDIERLQGDGRGVRWTEQTVDLIRGLEKVLGHGSLLAYLVAMTLRIVEIHRVLKDTGSFYVHCDPTASHYLKLVLDAVFCGQGGLFLNEIVWSYQTGGASKRWFAKKHDVILFYTKSDRYWFDPNAVREARTDKSLKRARNPTGARITADNVDKLPTDVFQIQALNPMAAERLGYPTQKPEALLERIIMASSREGDVVLDCYCGCGTTIAVAERLKRSWIGIDITYQSISLIMKRFEDTYRKNGTWPEIHANIKLDGVPRDVDSAMALARRNDDKTRKEFEKWAVLTYSNNQARVNEKKGPDGGIDGVAYFLQDKDRNGKAIFQVKSRPGTRLDLAALNNDRQRVEADFGFLICTGLADGPTRAMREEIAAAGKYQNPLLNRQDDRLQVVTIAELLPPHNRRLDLPMARVDAVKVARAIGDEEGQGIMDL